LRQKTEEEERIKQENQRIKEWEDKFDQDQKQKEDDLIKKFYSNKGNEKNKDNEDQEANVVNEDKEKNI